MKSLLVLASISVSVAAAHFAAADREVSAMAEPVVFQAPEKEERFRLRMVGHGDDCTVVKEPISGRGGTAELRLDGQCGSVSPSLREARYWIERPGGEVIFAAADGDMIAQFYAADGVAYESIEPARPLMDLVAE